MGARLKAFLFLGAAVALGSTVRYASADDGDAGVAVVRLDASSGGRLERRPVSSAAWEVACHAPCDVKLPLDGEYRVADPRPIGTPFRLAGVAGDVVTVRVKPPSVRRAGGVALIVVGAAIVVVGIAATFALGNSANAALHCMSSSRDDDSCGFPTLKALSFRFEQVVTILVSVAGGGAVGGGIALLATARPTTTQDVEARLRAAAYVRRPPLPDSYHDGFTRSAVVVPLTFLF